MFISKDHIMHYFDSDYLEGAHPLILQRLAETNLEQTPGYGEDRYCESAREKIRKACRCPHAEVHFLVGGTQANATIIKALLRPYEGVLSAVTGHINGHEAGAIEAGGHKVLTLPHTDGKISAESVERFMDAYNHDSNRLHLVKPGLLYISHPTEYGTIYTRNELESLSAVCKEHNIHFFMDGARMGYGLAAKNTDVTLETITRCCDVFYIGGTKIGALFGEAVVIPKPGLISHFFTIIKQQGALLAKGRILGLQFDTLFTDDLYFTISRHAIDMAEKLKNGMAKKGCRFFLQSPTNQQFVILDNQMIQKLRQKVSFSLWEPFDDTHTVARFATSWATQPGDIDHLLSLL